MSVQPEVPGGGLSCELLTAGEFWGMEGRWRALQEDVERAGPFQSWEWLQEWWAHFGAPAGRLLVPLEVRNGANRLIGIIPLYRSAGPGLRRLRVLGDNHPLDGLTEEPPILLRAGWERGALQATLHRLYSRGFPVKWDVLNLPALAHGEDVRPVGGVTRGRLQRLMRLALRAPGPVTLHLPSSWEQLHRSLSKSMRDNLAYYPRLLERKGHRWSVHRLAGRQEVAEGVDILTRLHRARADSRSGASHECHLPTERHRQFLQRCLPRLADRKMASLSLLYVDGEPVAAQAFLEAGGRLQFYHSGYAPEWRRFSPLTILHRETLRDAIARGVQVVDFLAEAQPWKTRWRAHAEGQSWELLCVYPRPCPLAWAVARRLYYQWRRPTKAAPASPGGEAPPRPPRRLPEHDGAGGVPGKQPPPYSLPRVDELD